MLPTIPDEQTPLLAVDETSEPGSDGATLAGPLNQGSQTPSILGKGSCDGVSEANRKTPLPWAQFSIVLFLQLAEPLTSQVIYPVSSISPVSPIQLLTALFFSLHLRSVSILRPQNQQIKPGRRFY